jgi:parvulin-like peptidyl-prolyl isomerase
MLVYKGKAVRATVPRVLLAAFAAVAALALTGCGGSDDAVPADAVAVVDGTEITRAELQELVDRARDQAKAQKQEFPKAGTPEYQGIQTRLVAYLVQRTQYEKEADALGIEITDKAVDAEIAKLVKKEYGGDVKKLEAAMEKQAYTMELLREDYAALLLRNGLVETITKGVEVSEEDIRDEYDRTAAQHSVPESREVRHILLAVKKNDDSVDYAASRALADEVFDELKSGADFAELAKKYSQDPSSADNGGKYTAIRGQSVAPFEQTAFNLSVGEVSRPVKTEYGYHLIEPLGQVKPGRVMPLSEVRERLEEQLLAARKNEAITEWATKISKKYQSKTSYAAGFAPPSTTTPDGSGDGG